MGIVNGHRKIVRIGELRWQDGMAAVSDWVRYERNTDEWVFAESPSPRAASRLREVEREQELREGPGVC
jgi:hypothetical protein